GRKIARYSTAVYASQDYLASHDLSDTESISWIGWDEGIAKPQWVLDSDYPAARVWHQLNESMIQMEAAKAGMGLAMIPCILGDPEPSLQRVPPGKAESKYDVWILTHSDLRNIARVRTFTRFVVDSVADYLHLIEGCPIDDSPTFF
ncbi:MAG TPA: LysR family transcriptional regulator, partial [Gammaproteobacteria bacterium]|nr:LysR family transcriptional regulator [Gammaproteobacteria bacterium]